MQTEKNTAIACYKSAEKKLTFHDYLGALADSSMAIEINDEFADAYFNRGRSKNALGDHHGAISDYTRVVELEPAHAKPYCYRGRIKSDLKDFQGGINDFTKAVELNPNYAGHILTGQRRFSASAKNVKRLPTSREPKVLAFGSLSQCWNSAHRIDGLGRKSFHYSPAPLPPGAPSR